MDTALRNYQHICRTCMCAEGIFYSIFESDNDKESIFLMLAITTPQLNIQADDELPRQICAECYNKLRIAFNFRELCIASDVQLRSKYMKVESSSSMSDLQIDPLEVNDDSSLVNIIEIDDKDTIEKKSDTWASSIDNHNIDICMGSRITSSASNDGDFMKEELFAAYKSRKHKTTTQSKNSETGAKKHTVKPEVKNSQQQQHSNTNKIHCESCDEVFPNKSTLRQHKRSHEKCFLCPDCGKSFNRGSTLRQHLIRHSDRNRFQCSECPSKFPCKGDLVCHMTSHRQMKPHECDICGSTFTRVSSLNHHKQIHSGKRPFKCKECQMTFVFIYHMRRHMRTHTGEKPYKCKFCDRAYSESGDLTKHLRTHIGEKTYACTQCPQAFRYKVELRNHRNEHYKEQQQQVDVIEST